MTFNLWRYTAIFIATTIGLSILNAITSRYGYDLPVGMSSWFPALVASMIEGQKWALASDEEFKARQAWGQAGYMTAAALVANIPVTLLSYLLLPETYALLGLVSGNLFGVIVLAFLVAIFFFNFLGYRIGFRAIRKQQGS